MSYRVEASTALGRWPLSIVREAGAQPCPELGPHYRFAMGENSEHATAQLVAAVVNGDQALAERICTLLNSESCDHPYGTGTICDYCGQDVAAPHTPDVTYLHGARDALAEVQRRLGSYSGPHVRRTTLDATLRDAAAELGLDEEAPESAPQTADEAHCDTCDGPCRDESDMDDDEDAPGNPPSAPVSASEPSGVPESTPDRSMPAEIEPGRFDVWGETTVDGGWLEMACNTCRSWSPGTDTDLADLAELVQRAAEHAEVCT